MKLEDISLQTWTLIPRGGSAIEGYKGTFIKEDNNARTDLLLFRDEEDQKHFVVEVTEVQSGKIKDPQINGFKVTPKKFRFDGTLLKYYIDIECSREDYLMEFTEIIKEISRKIFEGNEPVLSINEIVENWKAFLGSASNSLLNLNEQLGLFAELKLLVKMCTVNPSLALKSWRGPFRERHDFVFSDWTFEVKGTQRSDHIHVINGIEQLKPYNGKKLAFVSWIVNEGHAENSKSIQDLVYQIVNEELKGKSALIEEFFRLLSAAGYSKLYSEEYSKLKFDIIGSRMFIVDENFPKLTPSEIMMPVSSRVTEIKYTIDLTGMSGIDIEDIQWGNYLY